MLTTILSGFTTQPVENLFLATARVLELPVGSVERLGLAVKSHVLWAVYRAATGGRCSTFIGRSKFSGFHIAVGDRQITVTNLEKGTEYRVHPKSRPNSSEALDKNVYCSCPDYRFNRRGGSPCKHIFEAIARVGGQLLDWVEQIRNARATQQRRLEAAQQERDRKRAELEKAAETWEIEKFEIPKESEPIPGVIVKYDWPGFKVLVEVKPGDPRRTVPYVYCLGGIYVENNEIHYLSDRYPAQNFKPLPLTEENLAIACRDLLRFSEFAKDELWVKPNKPSVVKNVVSNAADCETAPPQKPQWLTAEYFTNLLALGNELPF